MVALRCASALLLVAVLLGQHGAAQADWREIQKIVPLDAVPNDNFGGGVAASNGILVVGARSHKSVVNGVTSLGAAFVHVCGSTTCSQVNKLTVPSETTTTNHFGLAVAVSRLSSNDPRFMVLVGEYGVSSNRGAAHVFDCSSPSQCVRTATLKLSDAVQNDYFGAVVALAGRTVIVGAYGKDSYRGAFYVYDCANPSVCSAPKKLTASDGTTNDHFGRALAAAGNIIVAGAASKNSNRGAVYVYVCTTPASCAQTAKLTPADSATDDHFGWAVGASSTDHVLVGAYGKGSAAGAVYVFDCSNPSTCTQLSKLQTANPTTGDHFGFAVSVSEKALLVGAHYRQSTQGGADVFACPTWSTCAYKASLSMSDAATNAYAGGTLALLNDLTAVVGATGDKAGIGAAYVFGANLYGCTFTMNGLPFDLNPLRGEYKAKNTAFPAYTEYISLCGAELNVTGCPAGAAVCEVANGRGVNYGMEPVTIRPVDDTGFEMIFSRPNDTVPCHSATIAFRCDASAGDGAPVHVSDDACGLRFEWRSVHACPRYCRQEFNGQTYDLYALHGKTYSVPNAQYPGFTDHLTVCDDVIEDVPDCAGASACQTLVGGRPTILGKAPVTLSFDGTNVVQTYTADPSSPFTARITFKCDPAAGSGLPDFSGTDPSGFQLSYFWVSAVACPL